MMQTLVPCIVSSLWGPIEAIMDYVMRTRLFCYCNAICSNAEQACHFAGLLAEAKKRSWHLGFRYHCSQQDEGKGTASRHATAVSNYVGLF